MTYAREITCTRRMRDVPFKETLHGVCELCRAAAEDQAASPALSISDLYGRMISPDILAIPGLAFTVEITEAVDVDGRVIAKE